jgi:hypothetical protein
MNETTRESVIFHFVVFSSPYWLQPPGSMKRGAWI